MQLIRSNFCRARSSPPRRKMYPTSLLTVLYPGPHGALPWSRHLRSCGPVVAIWHISAGRCRAYIVQGDGVVSPKVLHSRLTAHALPIPGLLLQPRTCWSEHCWTAQRLRTTSRRHCRQHAAGLHPSAAADILLGPGQLGADSMLCVGSMPPRTLHQLVITLDRCTFAGHFESSQIWFFGTRKDSMHQCSSM